MQREEEVHDGSLTSWLPNDSSFIAINPPPAVLNVVVIVTVAAIKVVSSSGDVKLREESEYFCVILTI